MHILILEAMRQNSEMWTEFIAQELRDDKSDTQNLDTKAGHKSYPGAFGNMALCNLCTVGMVFVANKSKQYNVT